MNKNFSFLLPAFLLVSVMLGLQGCPGKKTEPTPETKTNLLTRNWRVQKVTSTSGGTTTALYEAGATGNSVNYAAYRINFTSATNYTRTDQNAVETSGGWSFNAGETQINFNPGTPPAVNVVALTKDSFVFTYTDAADKNGSRELRFEMVPL